MEIDHTIVGTGDQDKDWNNLTAAQVDLASRGGGYMGIRGSVKLKGRFKLGSFPISVVGVSHDACLVGTDPKSSLCWGDDYDPIRDTSAVAYSGSDALAYDFESPNLALQTGDVFTVWADDNLANCPPNLTFQRPMEIHRVKEVRGTRVVFDDVLANAMLANPKIAKNPMIPGVTFADLKLAYTGLTENTRFLDFRKIDKLRIENVDIESGGPGPCLISSCIEADVSGFNANGKHNYDLSFGYQLMAGLVNGLRYRDSFVTGCRHAFTTTSISHGKTIPGGSNDIQWGTCRNCSVENVTAKQNGWKPTLTRPTGASLPSFDTHANGSGVRFVNCAGIAPADSINHVFNIRANGTELINPTVHGGGGSTRGIYIWASDCKVLGGSISNVWLGIAFETMKNHKLLNCLVKGTVLSNCSGPAISANGTEKLLIDGAAIRNSGWGNKPGVPMTLIWLKSGKETQVVHSTLPKDRNSYSIYLGMPSMIVGAAGNIMTGYGGGKNGTNLPAFGLNFID